MAKRYRRQAIYNYDLKQWQTFYKNNEGKIVIDKGVKTYQQARQQVKKNQYKKPDDLLTKKQSLTEYAKLHNQQSKQKKIDKYLKKKKLTKTEKQELETLSREAGYKKKQIKKKLPRKRKPPETVQYYKTKIPAVYFDSSSKGFYIQEITFKGGVYTTADGRKKKIAGLQKGIKKAFGQYKPDRLNVEIDGMEGEIDYKDISDLKTFEQAIANTVISGNGEKVWNRGEFEIKISLIKR